MFVSRWETRPRIATDVTLTAGPQSDMAARLFFVNLGGYNPLEFGELHSNVLIVAPDLAFGLDAGMVHLNDCTVSDEPHVPFGGVKNSGYGREGGRFSMEEMTELKWITVQRGQRAFPI